MLWLVGRDAPLRFAGLLQRVGLGEPIGERPCPPLLRERECRLGPSAGCERREHARGGTLGVVLARRGGGEGVPTEIVGSHRCAPALELSIGFGELALRFVQLASRGPDLREPAPRRVPDQVIVGIRLREERREKSLGGREIAAAERQAAAVVDEGLSQLRLLV